MVERNYLPFKISDPHNLLKFKSFPFLSPPSEGIIGPLMKPGCLTSSLALYAIYSKMSIEETAL